MKELLSDGLAAGGFGFSSSVAGSHNDADGDPVPSRCASHDEIVELATVCRAFPGTSLEMVPFAGQGPFPETVQKLMTRAHGARRAPAQLEHRSCECDERRRD